MFTIRAQYNGPAYEGSKPVPHIPEYFTIQCETYSVRSSPVAAGSERQVHCMKEGQSFPEGVTLFVGTHSEYNIIYVMNDRGKTIDTICG